jgi:hypothetical protein
MDRSVIADRFRTLLTDLDFAAIHIQKMSTELTSADRFKKLLTDLGHAKNFNNTVTDDVSIDWFRTLWTYLAFAQRFRTILIDLDYADQLIILLQS